MSKPASAAEEKESRQMSGRYSGSRSRAGSLAQKLASAINQNSFVTETERRARVRAAARQRWIGLTLAFVAVTLLSFCGVLPVLAFNVGASPAAVVAYQGFFATATMPLFVLLARRTGGVQPTRSGWLHIVLVGFFVAATQLCYNLGFFFTEVANVVAFAILAPVCTLPKPHSSTHARRREWNALPTRSCFEHGGNERCTRCRNLHPPKPA